MKLFVCLLLVFSGAEAATALEMTPKLKMDQLYHDAQRSFHKGDFNRSLSLFEKYLENSKKGINEEERLFWALDQVGYIYLRVQRDPQKAKTFFARYQKDKRLSEAEQDSIEEWVGASADWIAEKQKPSKIKNAQVLFSKGKYYFDSGIKKKTYPMDPRGNADLSIAETYLRPFLINFDSHKNTPDALLMMGRVKYNLRTDLNYWSENHYLKEVIRRFPGSEHAQFAWKTLDADTRSGYSGSGGDNTPASVKRMLERFKKMAYKKPLKKSPRS